MFVYLFSPFFFLFLVTCTFTNTLKFVVKDCDPSTGEPDDEGYEDEYVVSNRINPLSPMIHIQILQTDLKTFHYRFSGENLFKDQSIFP